MTTPGVADGAISELPEPVAQDEAASRSLWRHRDFMFLWGGQTISEIGSAVTMVALPLTAVVLLHASTFQVGLLSAAGTACFLLVALPAGLVVDRVAKRRLMLGCDLARMVIIGSVVVAAALGVLTMAQLFVVALLSGLATVFFDVAYQSYVPSLVAHSQLHEGNGKIGATQSFAQVTGPGLGGALFGLLKAGAMSLDAVSFAVSAVSLWLIRSREPQSVRESAAGSPAAGSQAGGAGAPRAGFGKELFAGLRFVMTHKVLRKIAACTGTANLFGSMAGALEIIFLIRVVQVQGRGRRAVQHRQPRRHPGRNLVEPALEVDRHSADHLVLDTRIRRGPDRHAAYGRRLAAGAVSGCRVRAELHRCRVQHCPAQLSAAHHPA